eukprot:6198174-Pleurochrysis_carterae.AAC.1
MKEANQGASSSTMEDGFPGEGPKITFASANVRGSVSDNKFFESAKLMADDKIDVVALQELNVHRQNLQTVEAHKRTAQTLGYKLFLATTTEQKQTGGTAILVSQKLLSEGCTVSTVIRHPDGNSIRWETSTV